MLKDTKRQGNLDLSHNTHIVGVKEESIRKNLMGGAAKTKVSHMAKNLTWEVEEA